MNEDKEPVRGQQAFGDSEPCRSGGDCCPPASGSIGKWRTVVFLVIVVAAGAVLATSLLNKSDSSPGQQGQAFAAIQPAVESDGSSSADVATKAQTSAVTRGASEGNAKASTATSQDAPVKAASALWGPELDSLASLNDVAAEKDGVFILLAGDEEPAEAVISAIEDAAGKIQANGMRLAAFELKKGTDSYAQVAAQLPVPCVVAMVKGRGASGVSGEITEAKLLQAFVAASRPSGCGPAGCGPAGCAPPR